MTPAKRRRLLRAIFVLFIVMSAGVAGRFFFRGQSIPSLLMGRKPGSATPGTPLVRPAPITNIKAPILRINTESPPLKSSFEPLKVKFDVLGNWKFIENKTPIPKAVKQLDGKWIEVTGFMLPINEPQHLTSFIIVQSLWGCCFGQTPAVNHVIMVNMEPGKTVEYYPDPVRVIGRFSVGETREEGYLVSIYRLEADKVIVK